MNLKSIKNLLYLVSLVGLYIFPVNYSFGNDDITRLVSKPASRKFKIRITSQKIYDNDPQATILTKNTERDVQLDTLFNKDTHLLLNDSVPSEIFTFNKEKYKKIIRGSVQKNVNTDPKEERKRISHISIAKLRSNNKSFVNLKKGKVQSDEQAKNYYKRLIKAARTFIEQGNIYQAEKSLEKAMKHSFGDVWTLAEIAGSFERISRFEFASKAYKKALSKRPNRIELLFNYAVCLRKDNKLDEAKEILKKLIEISPEFMLAHFNLGSIYYKKAMYYNSLDSFYTSVKLNPLSIDAYYNIAYILEKLNERTLAKKYYAKCIKLNPGDRQSKNALLRLGKKYSSKKNKKTYKSS